MTQRKADMLLLVLAVLWGSGYSVTKTAIEMTSPIQFLTCRYVISAVLSIIFFRKKIMNADKSDWYAGILLGVFLTVSMLIQTVGLQYTSAGKAVFIASAFVVMVPLFFWLAAKVKPARKIVLAAFLMLAGLGLLSIDPAGIDGVNKGDVLVLISAVTFAVHTTALGVFAPQKDPYLLSGIQFLTGGVLFFIISFFDPSRMPVTAEVIPAVIYSSLVITFLCTVTQVVCQKYTSPNHAAIIINLEAVFGSLVAIMFLGESYTPRMIVAFAITFAAVLIAEVNLNELVKSGEKRDDGKAAEEKDKTEEKGEKIVGEKTEDEI